MEYMFWLGVAIHTLDIPETLLLSWEAIAKAGFPSRPAPGSQSARRSPACTCWIDRPGAIAICFPSMRYLASYPASFSYWDVRVMRKRASFRRNLRWRDRNNFCPVWCCDLPGGHHRARMPRTPARGTKNLAMAVTTRGEIAGAYDVLRGNDAEVVNARTSK